MDVLRCKTPELVRKEIWTHVLAYNLIRTVMAQAASQKRHRTASDQLQGDAPDPRGVPAGDCQARPTAAPATAKCSIRQVLRAIARHRVADRPDRFEPRMAKRRPKNYDRLTKPRKEIKLDMIKRFRKI